MAKQFLTHLDLNKNQILNVALQNLSAHPTLPKEGQVYYNTLDKVIYFFDGTAWEPIAGDISEVIAGAGLSGGGDSGPVTLSLNPDNITIEVGAGGVVQIKDLGVTTDKIASGAVTTNKISDNAVTEAKIADSNVTNVKIANLAVDSSKLATSAVTTVKIADNAITFSKIQDIATMTVIGRVASGTGDPSAIQIISDLASASSTTLATSSAIKSYVDSTLTALGNLEGSFDANASVNFPVGATPTPGTKRGDYWYISVSGTVQGINFNVGDVLIAKVDNASTIDASDWIVLETNRDQASTSVLGLVRLATSSEVIAGSDNTKAVTPASIPDATTTSRGFTTHATSAETQAGTVNNKAVTPQGLASRTATETRTGLAEIATQTETNTGTDDSRFVTPLKLKTLLDNRVGGYAADIGNGTDASFALTHGLATEDVQVKIKDNTTKEFVETDIVVSSASVVTVSFASAPSTNRYRVIIKK